MRNTRKVCKPLLPLLLPVGLGGCPDYNTGQDPEPEGPLRVTRLTLLDATSRDVPVFTDTSVPDCSKPENQDALVCKADINRDHYGPHKSPPTPSSGREMRVVFNKIPLFIDGRELERRIDEPGRPPRFELADPEAARLTCSGCTGAPPARLSSRNSGSETTFDPTHPGTHPSDVPYGPALLLEVVPTMAQPFAALEPETTYQIELKPGLAGRNGERVALGAETQALLRFTTEPFKLLRVGIGDDAKDPWVYDGKAGDPRGPASFRIEGLAHNGVIRVVLNAPVDESVLQALSATATVGGMDVPLKMGLNRLTTMNMQTRCDPGQRRVLYLFPAAGTWGMGAGEARVTLRGADVRDLSQAPGHPAGQGRHALRGDITITATLTGQVASDQYPGLTADRVRATVDCP